MPLRPSLIHQIAGFLALADPRCMNEIDHNRIPQGQTCPTCHHDLTYYVGMVPRDWPAS
jgi:hypothetical protein